ARMIVDAIGGKLRPTGAQRQPDYSPKGFPDNQNSPPLLEDDTGIKLADLQHAARHEHAETLIDLLFRRTPIGWRAGLKREQIERAAQAVASVLGWDDERVRSE